MSCIPSLFFMVASSCPTSLGLSPPAAATDPDVRIDWDAYGVPHVYTEFDGNQASDERAYFGAGYAMAKLRLFQMLVERLYYQGRAAEFLGRGNASGGAARVYDECGRWAEASSPPNTPDAQSDVFLNSDRAARLWGLRRNAELIVADMAARDAEMLALLQAFSDGVNRYIDEVHADPGLKHALFATYAIPVDAQSDPWRPKDCVGILLDLCTRVMYSPFGEVKQYDVVSNMLAGLDPNGAVDEILAELVPFRCDDDAAVVSCSDVPQALLDQMQCFADAFGMDSRANCWVPGDPPHFSEAWVVSKDKNASGTSVIVSEPRLPVLAPNLLVELHMEGETFDVRGACLVGTPYVFFGSSKTTAWGFTALGTDQADLFRIALGESNGQEVYTIDGIEYPVERQTETIHVAGQSSDESVDFVLTPFGPLVTELVEQAEPGYAYALRQIAGFVREADPADPSVVFPNPVYDAPGLQHPPGSPCEQVQHPAPSPWIDVSRGFLDVYRAGDVAAFDAALEGWSYFGVNVVFGDSSGEIGYRATGHLPVRKNPVTVTDGTNSVDVPFAGRIVQDGSTLSNDWRTLVPHEYMPAKLAPARGYFYTANHMSIGSCYPITPRPGLAGHGPRSFRLGELLGVLDTHDLTAREIRDLRLDTVNVFARDMAALAESIPDAELDADALRAKRLLVCWNQKTGGRIDGSHPGSILAHHIRGTFRNPVLSAEWGEGFTGWAMWSRDALARIAAGGSLDSDEKTYVEGRLAGTWQRVSKLFDGTTPLWYDSLLALDPQIVPPPQDLMDDCVDTIASTCDPTTECDALADFYVETSLRPFWQTWRSFRTASLPELRLDSSSAGEYRLAEPFVCMDIDALFDQRGECYSQWVKVGQFDATLSMLANGQSEPGNPNSDVSAHAFDQEELWRTGGMKASPITESALPGPVQTEELVY